MTGIYLIKNLVTGHCYIGQAVNITKRWTRHKRDIMKLDYPLYRAMRIYGLDNFEFSILELCTREQLNSREVYWIAKYDSFKHGYNLTPGGDCNTNKNSRTYEVLDDVIQDLLTTYKPFTEIANQYGIHANTVYNINYGKTWYSSDLIYPLRKDSLSTLPSCPTCGGLISPKAKYCKSCISKARAKPSKEELIQHFAKLQNLSAIGRLFGVSPVTVKRWLNAYELPTTVVELKKFLGIKPKVTLKEDKKAPYKVYQCDKITHEVLQVFDSFAEATAFLGVPNKGHISEVCHGKRQNAYGYFWHL